MRPGSSEAPWDVGDPARGPLAHVLAEVEKVIVGQRRLIQRMLQALLTDGHVLVEGVPGLAKTLSVRTLATAVAADFRRIQFTPDLLPSDLVGTNVFDQRTGEFTPHKGPVFANIVLADEINRAPAKVQSALLEAMQERRVTIAGTTYQLPQPFVVLATQNPIEQEGTYPLPEAQVDRFMFKTLVGYPSMDEERAIVRRMTGAEEPRSSPVVVLAQVEAAKRQVLAVRVEDRILDYIVRLVSATRSLDGTPGGPRWVEYGASPRASIWLTKAAMAHAFLCGRDYTKPEDVKEVAFDVLRHRIIVTFEAQAEGVTSDAVIQRVLAGVPVP
jgi:MoxR-like ATPase